MPKSKTREALSVTVKLPRQAWPEELKPPTYAPGTAISLLRGRLSSRQAIMVLRIEGTLPEIGKTLTYWKCCGFTVETGDRPENQDPLADPALFNHPFPLSTAAGAPSGAPASIYPVPPDLNLKTAVLKASQRLDCPDSAFRTLCVRQEIGI